MVLPTAIMFWVAPRLLMREVGASVTVHVLSALRTVTRACGFSYLDVRIGAATATGCAASEVPQPSCEKAAPARRPSTAKKVQDLIIEASKKARGIMAHTPGRRRLCRPLPSTYRDPIIAPRRKCSTAGAAAG